MSDITNIKETRPLLSRPLVEALVIVLIIVGLVLLIRPAAKLATNPQGPYGAWVPDESPKEINRIRHGTGLSIIAPENWDPITKPSFSNDNVSPCIVIHARGYPAARIKSSIAVSKSESPNENFLIDALETEFQGYPAYEKAGYELTTFEYTNHEMYVHRENAWWLITVSLKGSYDELPEEFRPYLDSIQFPETDRSNEAPVNNQIEDEESSES